MVKLKIYIFRHGQTFYNEEGIFTGWLNSRLTPLGVKQAKIMANKLKDKKIDVAFSTKLGRSRQTLKEVLKFHPECKQVIIDNRIIERNYGNLNGMSHKEFIKKYGEEKYKMVHRGYDVKPPKGESFKDVEKRVAPFVKDLKKLMKEKKVNVAISAHGNSIRLFRKIMEKATKEQAIKWVIPYDGYYEYTING